MDVPLGVTIILMRRERDTNLSWTCRTCPGLGLQGTVEMWFLSLTMLCAVHHRCPVIEAILDVQLWSIVAYIFHHFLFNLSTRFSAVCEGQLEQLLIDIMVWHWHYDMSFDYFCLWSISRCSPSYLHICFPLLTIYSGIIDATLILLPELHVCSFFSQVYFAEHSSAGSQGYSRCH